MESQPGQGSTFRVYLPCTEAAPEEPQSAEPVPPITEPGHAPADEASC